MRSPTSSWRRSVAAALLVTASPLAAQGVRPAVTVEVRIDGALYRSRLGDAACVDRCASVRSALQDSVRRAFERHFGFLDWRSAPRPSPDTVIVSWANTATEAGRLELRMHGRRRAARGRVTRLPFESFVTIANRPARDWQQPDVVQGAWMTRLREILRNPSDAQVITREVLANIPLDPLVNVGPSEDVTVGLGPSVIRANPSKHPTFLVRMNVVDPATGDIANARQDTTEMQLAACSRAGTPTKYKCRVMLVAYPERTPPDTLSLPSELADLARRALREPVTLHVWTFFPADPADDAPVRQP